MRLPVCALMTTLAAPSEGAALTANGLTFGRTLLVGGAPPSSAAAKGQLWGFSNGKG